MWNKPVSCSSIQHPSGCPSPDTAPLLSLSAACCHIMLRSFSLYCFTTTNRSFIQPFIYTREIVEGRLSFPMTWSQLHKQRKGKTTTKRYTSREKATPQLANKKPPTCPLSSPTTGCICSYTLFLLRNSTLTLSTHCELLN